MKNRFNSEELNAKKFLSGFRPFIVELKRKKINLEQMEALALPKGLKYDDVRVQGGASQNPTEERYILAAEAYDEYMRALERYKKEKEEISEVIRKVSERDADCGAVLDMIYICGMPNDAALKSLNVSHTTFYRRYHKAHKLAAGELKKIN